MYCKWQLIFGDVAKDIIGFARLMTTMCSLDAPNFLKQVADQPMCPAKCETAEGQ
jgi:hypothetical protein